MSSTASPHIPYRCEGIKEMERALRNWLRKNEPGYAAVFSNSSRGRRERRLQKKKACKENPPPKEREQ